MIREQKKDKIIRILLLSNGLISVVIVVLIFLFLFKEAFPLITSGEFSKLLNNTWSPVSYQNESFGLLPLIAGSFLVTVLAALIAIPFGISGAVYISEVASL